MGIFQYIYKCDGVNMKKVDRILKYKKNSDIFLI